MTQAHDSTLPAAPVRARDARHPGGNGFRSLILFVLVLAAATGAILWDYLSGTRYLAFTDVGSDTYFQFFPIGFHLAKSLAALQLPAWSFDIGLGSVTSFGLDPFVFLSALGGPDRVLELRVWIYATKLLLAGMEFLAFLYLIGIRIEVSAIGGLAYALSGYAMVDGQWDPLASDLTAYAAVLVALAYYFRTGRGFVIPLAVVWALANAFFVSLGVFLFYVFVAHLLAAPDRARVARRWLTRILPLVAIGFALYAPVLLPNIHNLWDSPRVSGGQSLFAHQWQAAFAISDPEILTAEIAGLFHKNLLGIGNDYRGWTNYLEGPGFWVGLLPLLAISQLWRGDRNDRRLLIIGMLALTLYLVWPAMRYSAYAFAVPYFRTSSLWLSILLLVLAARALEGVIGRGLSWLPLAIGMGVLAALLAVAVATHRPIVNIHHLGLLGASALLAVPALMVWGRPAWPAGYKYLAVLAVIGLEAVMIHRPSFHDGRRPVGHPAVGFDDGAGQVIRELQARDPGVYRIEKSFASVSLCDSLVQGYMGASSYWYQSRSAVAIFHGLGLIPETRREANFTNWLPGLGPRMPLYSLFGIRYLITQFPLDWPGWQEAGRVPQWGLRIFRNDYALPLGVVYTTYLDAAEFKQRATEVQDMTILDAAVVGEDQRWRLAGQDASPSLPDPSDLAASYFGPLSRRAAGGFAIETFAHDHIVGSVTSHATGSLLFTFPYSRGWSVSVDGREVDTYALNFGMLAVDVAPGTHRVELSFAPPGRRAGMWLAAIAALGLIGVCRAGGDAGRRQRE